jgi:hypothetical protein
LAIILNNVSFRLKTLQFALVMAVVIFLGWYSRIYFATPLSDVAMPDGESVPQSRGLFVLVMLTLPDQLMQVWRAFDTMPFGLFDRWPYFVCAAFWLLSSWIVGGAAFAVLGLTHRFHPVEAVGLSIAAGLNLLSLTTLVIGVAGGSASRWPMIVAICVLLGLATWLWNRSCKSGSSNKVSPENRTPEALGYWDQRRIIFLAFACALLCVFYFLGAVLPPSEFDVREYHLQGPKEFFQTGRIQFLAHNIYANMPMGTEMHALAWMSLWGGVDGWYHGALIGKVIFASFSIVTAMILSGSVARQAGSIAGWIVACTWLGMPGIAEVSKLGLIDQAVACYLAASVSVLFALHDKRAQDGSNPSGLILLLGWFLGATAACKYTAVPFVVLPGVAIALWIMIPSAMSMRRVTVLVGTLILGGAFGGGLWYAKNSALAGNPVYPLASGVLGGKTMNLAKAKQWNDAHRVPVLPAAGEMEQLGDYRLSTLSNEFGQITVYSRYLGLLLIPLCVVGLLTSRSGFTWLLVIWFVGYIAVWYFFTHRLERFWLPALVIPAIIAGQGGSWLLKQEKGIVGTVFLAMGLLTSLCFLALWPFSDNRYLVALTSLRDDQFISPRSSQQSSDNSLGAASRVPLHQRWINTQLTQSDKVLVVGDAQVFDIRIPILYSTCFDASPLEEIATGKSPEEIWQSMRDRGITHILVHWGEIARYRSPGNYGFSPTITRELLQSLVGQKIITPTPWPIPSEIAELYKVASEFNTSE